MFAGCSSLTRICGADNILVLEFVARISIRISKFPFSNFIAGVSAVLWISPNPNSFVLPIFNDHSVP